MIAVALFFVLVTLQQVVFYAPYKLEKGVWQQQRQAHALEVKSWQQEREERMRERDQQMKERQAFKEERERERLLFEEERARERAQQERVRRAFKEEQAREHQLLKEERAVRLREREAFEQERDQWEQERIAHKPYWSPPWLHSTACLAYNTRMYKARLRNLPLDSDWLGACRSTPLELNGHVLATPESCDLSDDYVYGSWNIDFDQPECQPRWGDWTWDKGCIRPGVHALEAPLWGQKYGDDIYAMCKTTPGVLAGWRDMGLPMQCRQEGDKDIGMVGRWEFLDDQCR
ncbi:hypothetical protein EUX98_g5959 [Antrodiella citrinella]|uniref:Uncharacterized protein n=1 Tax=Antrodiella citrinella TaxID=2447956 RepID=A0A4S4MR64_9APHY|nr:hypothetical protein EUX98_g5959 [Antrodiella citrinella]